MTLAAKLFEKPSVTGNIGDWQSRHMTAVHLPRGFERPIVWMLEQWLRYADVHQNRYDSKIGEDYVLGVYWQDIGKAIRGLLNGECGRLDCGTLDGLILNTMQECGIDISDL